MSSDFVIKSASFEGPLEVLLELIEARKLSINQVSLALITDEYVHFLETVGVADREALSQFITVAATLMLIKSRTLLPELALTEEEEGNIDELERRLVTYAHIRELTKYIDDTYNTSPRFAPRRSIVRSPIFTPDPQVNLQSLYALALHTITQVPVEEQLPETKVKKTLDIKDVMESVVERIRNLSKTSFSALVQTSDIQEKKIAIVVHFLALLELMKTMEWSVDQAGAFSDIVIQSTHI